MSISILEDEIDKKRRELIDKGITRREAPLQPTEVKNQKPGRVYRGAYNDPRRIAELTSQGYSLCTAKGKDAEQFAVDDQKADGTHVYKDVVLMSCAQDVYVERHAGYRLEADNMSQHLRDAARDKLNRILVEQGGAPANRDYTSDDSRQGKTRLFVEEDS